MPNYLRHLRLVGSLPACGSHNVSPRIRAITLFFNRNVVDDAVWANNQRQIRMFQGSTKVDVLVTRISRTVNFSQRRKIFVRPVGRLRGNTRYTIVIGPNLKSKQGHRLGKPVWVSFTTGRNGIISGE